MTTHLLVPMCPAVLGPGGVVPLAERKRVLVTLDVAELSAGGSLTVSLEGSATGASWRVLGTVENITAEGAFTRSSFTAPPEFSLGLMRFIRANVTSLEGTAMLEVRLTARFFDMAVPSDATLLSKELRTYSEADRLAVQAESAVVAMLEPCASSRLAVDGIEESIRAEIVDQAEHLYRRHRVGISTDPTAAVTLRSMPRNAPNFGRRLEKYLKPTRTAWFGR